MLAALLSLLNEARLLEHLLGDVNRRARSERERDRIARARVERDYAVAGADADAREIRVLAQIANLHGLDLRAELREDRAQEVVGHWSSGLDALELARDRGGFHEADPDRQ